MGTSRGELDQQPNRFKFEQQQLQEEEGSLLPRKPQAIMPIKFFKVSYK
jgi:hypothetical protein